MCLLLETIKISNREIENVFYHNERMNRSRKELFLAADFIRIENDIVIPKDINTGVYKLRILYQLKIEKVEFLPYRIKVINKLKLVEDNKIEYGYKFADRERLNYLVENAKEADDIIIIKNGFVTDTSYSNLVFNDGNCWVTPATYLLNGTKRQMLLDKGIIKERVIKAEDIPRYTHCKLINAMMDFEESPVISVNNIISR